MSVFQELYDSEINFSISVLWDGGFELKMGDNLNGFDAEATLPRWRCGELDDANRDPMYPLLKFAKTPR